MGAWVSSSHRASIIRPLDMICILSQSVFEPTTEAVIDWLRFWLIPFVRLNVDDIKTAPLSITLDAQGTVLSCQAGNIPVDPSRIKVVWYRRWGPYSEQSQNGKALFVGVIQEDVWEKNVVSAVVHLRRELRVVGTFIFDCLSSARWLSHPLTSTLNKLQVLRLASECGIDIPKTLVSSDRTALATFVSKHDRVITKPIGDGVVFELGGSSFFSYTSVVNEDPFTRNGNDLVFPTLLQECLNKQYEIRAFFLDGDFYSMAIFSQSDQQTNVDFRRYQYRRPNRTVPFRLPEDLSDKLALLLRKLDLETASIDLVRTAEGRFVFLEINPVGQFGMVSYPCNYHLEHHVASALATRMTNE